MTSQLSFSDLSVRAVRAKRGPMLAAKMIAILYVHRRWMHRAELEQSHGMTPRECRLARQCAHGRVLYGRSGFKLLKWATADEVRKCSGALVGQIKAMQAEHSQLIRRAHAALARKGEVL